MTVIAVATRSGMVECEFHGSVVVRDSSGVVRFAVGEPGRIIYPRSTSKLMQVATLVDLGLRLPPRLLALAASSHSGEDYHRAAALEILAAADRNESDLDNTPDLPYDPTVAAAYLRSGGTATSLAQNCSGKHAAMIATCVIRGWPVSGYLDPTHPLQQAISASMARAAGERIDHIGVDGCGAPAHAFSLLGLAKAFGDARREHPAATVVEAMLRHPEMVGGSGRDVTLLMRALPGVLVKDGADGVMAASLIDGTGIALKIADGAPAPRIAVLVSVLEHFGLNVDAARTAVPLLVFGHGEPVGEIRSTLF